MGGADRGRMPPPPALMAVPLLAVVINLQSGTLLWAQSMPWQKGLRRRPRCPSLLICLFVVMIVYSSKCGVENFWDSAKSGL